MLDRARAAPADLAGAALIALATTLLLEGTRVFVSYLVFVVDQSQRVELAGLALGVFLAVGLGGPLARLLGPRRALLGGALLLAAARLALQFWEAPVPRLALGAAVVISWGWLLLAALSGGLPRAASAQGVALGLGLDLAVRVVFGSLDLPWDPTFARHVATLLLVGALLAAAWLARAAPLADEPAGSNLALLAVGPGLALYHLVSGNLGLATVGLGRWTGSYPFAGLLLAVGVGLGLLAPLGRERELSSSRPWPWHVMYAVAGVSGSIVVLAIALSDLPFMLGFVAAINVIALRRAVDSPVRARGVRPRGPALWFTLGMLAQAGLLFAYYSATGARVFMYVALVLLTIITYGSQAQARAWGLRRWASPFPVATVGALLALACLWQFATWDAPQAAVAQAGDTLTVMTYNLQSGYARDNHWSLEAQARVIAAQQPDIVILEEVSRGWLVTTGNDELLWLSQRLGMPYVWGPASDDGLWGNAILSRVALADTGTTRFASTQNLKRGAVRARVATAAGAVWVYGTHLDNPSGAGAMRREQVDELLRFVGDAQPAIIGGDFNATPGSDVIAALQSAGFDDPGAQLGPAATTSEDGKRIDYVLLRGQVTAEEAKIPDVWASDHRPVVVRVRVGE